MQHEPSVEKGKALFNDTTLGTSGKSCGSCHPDGKGLETVGTKENLAATVNACIKAPLKGKALDGNSVEMQSLLLYLKSLGKM
jgi:cytochrome c peroxidase